MSVSHKKAVAEERLEDSQRHLYWEPHEASGTHWQYAAVEALQAIGFALLALVDAVQTAGSKIR